MSLTSQVLIVIALAAVALTLIAGLYSLARGGEFAQKHSNKLMRLRVALQAAAIILMVIVLAFQL